MSRGPGAQVIEPNLEIEAALRLEDQGHVAFEQPNGEDGLLALAVGPEDVEDLVAHLEPEAEFGVFDALREDWWQLEVE